MHASLLQKHSGPILRLAAQCSRFATPLPSSILRHPSSLSPRFFQNASINRSSISTSSGEPSLYASQQVSDMKDSVLEIRPTPAHSPTELPSPDPDNALRSAKLAALHARLGLSDKIPPQTLARTLVDPSADQDERFNNSNLSLLGHNIINFHASEWLMCKYPRLPMSIFFEAMRAHVGIESLADVASQWGVDSAIAPGGEVDPGYLQWSADPEKVKRQSSWGIERTEASFLDKFKWRRGVSSRVAYDDVFGDTVHENTYESKPEPTLPADIAKVKKDEFEKLRNTVHYNFVCAIVGAIYLHCGRNAALVFTRSHILSRKLELHRLFEFRSPTVELTRLCAREGFQSPIARLESETGRLSRTPVYVVGIYSGQEKIGEGVAASLDYARLQAAMNALKAWYLYSPGNVQIPSVSTSNWTPPHIDMGEII